MFDGPLMLRVNWPVVDTIHPQSNKFATGVNIKATGEYKLCLCHAFLIFSFKQKINCTTQFTVLNLVNNYVRFH